jgi:hypothetical protein
MYQARHYPKKEYSYEEYRKYKELLDCIEYKIYLKYKLNRYSHIKSTETNISARGYYDDRLYNCYTMGENGGKTLSILNRRYNITGSFWFNVLPLFKSMLDVLSLSCVSKELHSIVRSLDYKLPIQVHINQTICFFDNPFIQDKIEVLYLGLCAHEL